MCLCLRLLQAAFPDTSNEQEQSETSSTDSGTDMPSKSSPFIRLFEHKLAPSPKLFVILLREAIRNNDPCYFVFILSLSLEKLSPEQQHFLPARAILKAKHKRLEPLQRLFGRVHPADAFYAYALVSRTAEQYAKVVDCANKAWKSLIKILGNLVTKAAETEYINAAMGQRDLAKEILSLCGKVVDSFRMIYQHLDSGGVLSNEQETALEYYGRHVFAYRRLADKLVHRFVTKYEACLREQQPDVNCDKRILDLYGFKEALALPDLEEVYPKPSVPSSADWHKRYSDRRPVAKKLTKEEEMELRAKEHTEFMQSAGSRPPVRISVPSGKNKITEGDLGD